MKKLFKSLFVATLLTSTGSAFAQQMPTIPVDKNVRIGKLENGLTYYIRRNTTNEKRADFYIAQKVGSILEEPQQRGLAHFLEHMAFNGTKHFPGTDKALGLVPWCESVGIKFGTNLNAGTGIDQTIYNISNAPVTRDGIIDSCLLILHDWSNDLLLSDKEIDKERGVIHEEWRSRMSASQRFQEKAMPVIYPGSKYADCSPIGTMEVVDNFKYQVLRDYYEKWYRPDLQGLVIVGDIDVDIIEAKIKSLFADIAKPVNPATRIYFPVEDNKEPIVFIGKDKEQQNVQIIVFNKHDAFPDSLKNNMQYLLQNYAKGMISVMINARLNELKQTANPPYIYASSYDQMFFASRTKSSFTGIAICKDDDIELALTSLLRETERAKRFGFTESEYVRARAEYISQLESDYNERAKTKNSTYVNQYIKNFLSNEPIPSIEDKFTIINEIAPKIPISMINETMKSFFTEGNLVITLFGPDKEDIIYPTKEKLLDISNKVKTENITAYVDKVSNEPLIAKSPKAGKVVSKKENTIYGTTTLTLSNGVKIIVKKTDFKANEIHMKAISLGGNSLIPNSELTNMKALYNVATLGGLGNFSTINLEKTLAGKQVYVDPYIEENVEGVNGFCTPKDLETMLQLTYLTFTSPRMDMDVFKSYIKREKASLENMEANPMVAFHDSIEATNFNNHPRALRLKKEMLDKIDYQKCINLYKERFRNAGDFTFTLVGNVDLAKATPLLEKYLGSLPSTNKKETFKDQNIDIRKGIITNEFYKKQETAKASVQITYSGKCKYNLENEVLINALSQILTIVYTEKVREQEGGTYGVHVNGEITKLPKETVKLSIYYQTDPSKKNKLTQIIFDEATAMTKVCTSETNLTKVKEYLLKKNKENLKENKFWLTNIINSVFNNVDMTTNYEAVVNKLTTTDIMKFAQSLFNQNNRIEVTMTSPVTK